MLIIRIVILKLFASFLSERIQARLFLFTVIMNISNSEFIIPTFKSITEQTIGFNSIQVIMNMTNSHDGLNICQAYHRKYPEHVLVHRADMDLFHMSDAILGEYVLSMQAGDVLDRNTLNTILRSFELYRNVDCVIPAYGYSKQCHGIKTTTFHGNSAKSVRGYALKRKILEIPHLSHLNCTHNQNVHYSWLC